MKDQNRKQIIQILFLGLVLLLLQPACKEDPKSRINKISTLQLPGVTITEVQRITGGSFTPEGHNTTYTELPDFVRVAVSLQPVEGSTIHAEVWLPENREDWNNRFLGTGNGAGGGRIRFDPMAAALKRGFAAANTDLGTHPHANSKVGVPESWVDFGYRAALPRGLRWIFSGCAR